jgi:arylsulfatase A-like enzyme
MKCNLYDGGTGIFLIMRGPSGFSGGRIINSMVSTVDIFPTICELLEIEQPERLDGTSIMPLIRSEKEEIRDELFGQVNYHAAYQPMRSVRTERYKYIRRYGNMKKPVLPNCDDGLSKQYWLDHGWRDMVLPEEELYDLVFDPGERNNLADKPENEDALVMMRSRLDKLMRTSGDPLARGYIIAPPDANLNRETDTSPKDKTWKASELYDFNKM